MDTKYNGWTNYETWRVNLEIFDGVLVTDWFAPEDGRPELRDVAEYLRDCVEDHIEETSVEGIGRDYALAFVSAVNWREIAEHMLDDVQWPEEEGAA